jgi:hypothetical protein
VSPSGPYRPFGPYDYQHLPTGPALHVDWDRAFPMSVERLVDTARNSGWPIYGGGLIDMRNPQCPTIDAMLILERGTARDRFDAFREWIRVQPGIAISVISRYGTETYQQ